MSRSAATVAHALADSRGDGEASAILEALPNPLLTLAADEAIGFANSAAEHFFQASAASLKRMGLGEIIASTSPLRHLIAQVRQSQATVNEYGVRIGTPRTGGERVVDLQLAALSERPGTVILLVQQRSMALKLDRQLTHRGAARAVSGLASMLAHEIKNPLSGIRGAAQLIEPALESEDDRALARLICAETDRIRDLVDQMEVFSDERPLAREPVNIHSVLDQVRALAHAGFAQGMVIRDDYDPSLPPVLGHRDQLLQVFMNLIKNAAEAIAGSGRTGEIVVTTAYRPGIKLAVPGEGARVSLPLEVAVRDSGPGVPDDLLAHIFDPFVTSKSGGRGLGLALVAKIVRDHGGMVECDTSPRRTSFRVLLPLYNEPDTGSGGVS
jgi:two-component system, NtrC family, nitrogen regulation sensor histidine kinase GlnL